MESSDDFHLIFLYLQSIYLPFHLDIILPYIFPEARSRIYERSISLRFLDINFRVIRLEVSVYKVYIILSYIFPRPEAEFMNSQFR
jgi:hypothetical protein